MVICKDELIQLQDGSVDNIGCVYMYKGRIIRIINEFSRKHVVQLMKSGLIEKLTQEGLLVDSWISNDVDEDGRMVLEHRRIIPRAYLPQWSFEMMRDVAKSVLKLNMICWEYGYELKDCHQFNILFDGIKPVYVDFGSIVKKNDGNRKTGWIAREQFLKHYYYPLKLWSRGYTNTVEALMKSTLNLDIKEMRGILYHIPYNIVDLFSKYSSDKNKTPILDMQELAFKVDRIKCHNNTSWGEYQSCLWEKNVKEPRFDYEIEWINGMSDIETMIEVGANQGYFSYLVATRTKVERIIATDYDKKAVDIMYQKIKREGGLANRITPLVLDFVWMPFFRLKEYRSDLVVANALTHHLLLTQGMKMSEIAARLAELTKKYVIVEFMEYGVHQRKSDLPKWYKLDNFLMELQKKFTIIQVHKIERKRTMIIGIKL